MADLEQTIKARRSTRKFLSTPVPRTLLNEALALAQCAPSNSNIQPWFVVIADGVRRDRLRQALLTEAEQVPPVLLPLPAKFQHHRFAVGEQLYASMGIAREDTASREAVVLANYEFFGAPVVAIICIDQELGLADIMSVGLYVQTLLLALTVRGLGTCCEVSLATYPHILRTELNIPPNLSIICGVAIGYTDPDVPVNHIRVARAPVGNNVVILDS